MKQIENNIAGNPHWDKNLVKDISFIKKHLRYRLNKRILSGSFAFAILLAFILRFNALIFVFHHGMKHGLVAMLLTILFIIVAFALTISGFIRQLKFVAVPTPFFSTENQKLVQQFLTSQHLAVYRHPDAPEVFQIISKNISGSSKMEQREVMIFIADDKRILINSHYTGKSFPLSFSSRQYKQMAKRLKEWINIYCASANKNIVPVNTF